MEKTLSMIKPDAISRNISGKIIAMIEENGLQIVAQRMVKLTEKQAAEFYAVHNQKAFFASLIENITSGAVITMVLKGENAVAKYRTLMGSTNPAAADDGTIRKNYALSIDKNSVHGSDSLENAEKEIKFFFSDLEIVR